MTTKAQPSEAHVEMLIKRYCALARPIMLRFMTVNACISATRVTCLFFKSFGLTAEPVATKFVVEIPSMNLAYTAGLSEEEMATAKAHRRVFEPGWNGHLVARVARNWLVDPGFDQVATALGDAFPAEPKPVCNLFPLPGADDSFHVEYGAVADNGLKFTIHYVTTNDQEWRETEAWNDEGLPWLANEIMTAVRQDIEAMSRV